MPNDVSERSGALPSLRSIGAVPALPELTGAASQISWANEIRSQVKASFDRVGSAIQSGLNRYKGLEPQEIETLLQLVEQHRAAILAASDARYFLDHWQDPVDRVQRLIHADPVWKSISEARSVRNPRQDALVPVRYMGFDDKAGIRIFKFGRLPAAPGTPVFTVHADVTLFLKHKISFQDGPAMCSAIVSMSEEEKHQLTDDDCMKYVALRPSRTERKAPKRKPAIPPDA